MPRAIASDLRQALDSDDQFWLAAQPKVQAIDGRMVGVEALLRWTHPERGEVGPGEFIAAAEDAGLMVELGRWVLRRGAEVAKELSLRPALGHLQVALNVSSPELLSPDFVDHVTTTLDDVGVRPQQLVLEMTEETLAQDAELVASRLQDLRHLGVSISIDDFGTGHASLGRLRTLPIDELKVDRSFVLGAVGQDGRGRAILRTLATLGRELGMDVVAEGIETEEQLQAVRDAGIDLVQGFWFGRPIRPEILVESYDRSIQSEIKATTAE